jgi:hypothetical protein
MASIFSRSRRLNIYIQYRVPEEPSTKSSTVLLTSTLVRLLKICQTGFQNSVKNYFRLWKRHSGQALSSANSFDFIDLMPGILAIGALGHRQGNAAPVSTTRHKNRQSKSQHPPFLTHLGRKSAIQLVERRRLSYKQYLFI